jgi:orotate phosphoribosyltransferase
MTEVLAYPQVLSVREQLFNLIQTKGLKKGNVTLSSGKKSDLYFDLRPLSLSPDSAPLIAEMMIKKLPNSAKIRVGGLEAGAIPVAAAICTKYDGKSDLGGFFVRKQAKGHGKNKKIEGNFDPQAVVIIVEDVATTGNSILKAAETVRNAGGEVKTAIVVVDREENAYETLKNEGIELISLFKQGDFE